jgi:Retinoic acid induced 16-like protein
MWNRIRNSPKRGVRQLSGSGLNDPKLRFDYTKDACSELLRQTNVENRQYDMLARAMQVLIDIFKEEATSVGENVCVRYFISQDCLQVLGTRFKEFPPTILPKMCALIRTILESDQRGVVSRDKNLVLGVTAFLRSMISYRIDRHCEEIFSELLFVIASKLKTEPRELVRWFHVLGLLNQEQPSSHPVDHPLFYLLLDYVYHEGTVGEYARTGLLYLIDVVSSSRDLEQWMIKSDLSTLMASGLGALYSQLNRGVIQHSNLLGEEPPIIALSNEARMKRELDIEESQSSEIHDNPTVTELGPETKHNLATFLSYLQFWQDMLTHCRSETLAACLLGHFDHLFLRQLLYPSLIQSTDSEGGYSVSLITMLRFILQTLDHNQLSQLIVCYFLGIPLNKDYGGAVRTVQSLAVDALLSSEDGTPLLTLKDVIFSGLESGNPRMVTATLQLLSCLVQKYYPYVQETLITTTRDDHLPAPYQVSLRELKILRNIQVDLEQNEHMPIDEYESDMEVRILTCPFVLPGKSCTLLPDELQRLDLVNKTLLKQVGIFPTRQKIRPDDKLMNKILQLLCRYYENASEVNLVLTGFLVDLGSCGWISLRGWSFLSLEGHKLMSLDDNYVLGKSEFLRILRDLADQYQHYSVVIDKFDSGLLEFEQNLKVGHDISDALNVGPEDYVVDIKGNEFSSEDEESSTGDSLSRDAPSEDDENDGGLEVTPSRSSRPLARLNFTSNSSRSSSRPKDSPKITDQFGTLPRRLVSKALSSRSSSQPDSDNSPARILFRQETESSGSGNSSENALDSNLAINRSSRRSDPFISEALLAKIASKVQLIPPPTLELSIPVSGRLIEPTSTMVQTISLSQLFGNIIILREFVKEMEALVRVRTWLVDPTV